MATLGRKIAGARHEAGLTQAQLGEAVGVTGESVRQWESDRTRPRVDKLKLVADTLGRSVSYFLDDGDTATTELAGVTISGPPDVLERIAAALHAEERAQAATPTHAADQGLRPNRRHTGINELLDRLEEAKAQGTREVELVDRRGLTVKLTITPEEEEQLRTTGFSGPAVDSVDKAVEMLLMWREWQIKEQSEAAQRGRT